MLKYLICNSLLWLTLVSLFLSLCIMCLRMCVEFSEEILTAVH